MLLVQYTLSQDWEIPIKGFFIASPKRHIEKLCELTDDESILHRLMCFCVIGKHIYGTLYMVNPYVEGAYPTHIESIAVLKLKK